MVSLNESLSSFSSFLALESNQTLSLFFYLSFVTVVIVIYAVIVYYFYRFLARKNILTLNLNRFNNYENPSLVKFFAFIFYIIEFIILLPIMTLIWFVVLSILLLLLAEGMEIHFILLISASLIASVRITSYVSENLSKDLAKLVPFTLLVIALTKSSFLDISSIATRISEIPQLYSNILYFIVFIVGVEVIMRIMDLLVNLNNFGELGTEK